MDKNSFISSFRNNTTRNAPKLFMLFLVLILITEGAVNLLSPYIVAYSPYFNVSASVMMAQTENIDKNILIFGDSSAREAINPQRLYQDTELTCANLATGGTAIAINYFLLQDYLKFNNPPQKIIIMNSLNSWDGDPSDSSFGRLLRNHPGKMFELLLSLRLIESNYGKLLREVPRYLLPSQRNREALRNAIWKVISMEMTISEVLIENQQIITELKQRRLGETVYKMDRENTAEERENSLLKRIKTVRENEFSVSPWNRYYLERLVTLAEENDIAVLICLPPVRKEIYEDDSGKEYLYLYKTFIEDVCRSHSNVIMITEDFYFVTAAQIYDNGNHLNAEESIIFTDMLAQKLLK